MKPLAHNQSELLKATTSKIRITPIATAAAAADFTSRLHNAQSIFPSNLNKLA